MDTRKLDHVYMHLVHKHIFVIGCTDNKQMLYLSAAEIWPSNFYIYEVWNSVEQFLDMSATLWRTY
jgi:hypothetical protein